ncbi:hypothetical protein BHM03_00062243, partial [Ensete ventricosum]
MRPIPVGSLQPLMTVFTHAWPPLDAVAAYVRLSAVRPPLAHCHQRATAACAIGSTPGMGHLLLRLPPPSYPLASHIRPRGSHCVDDGTRGSALPRIDAMFDRYDDAKLVFGPEGMGNKKPSQQLLMMPEVSLCGDADETKTVPDASSIGNHGNRGDNDSHARRGPRIDGLNIPITTLEEPSFIYRLFKPYPSYVGCRERTHTWIYLYFLSFTTRVAERGGSAFYHVSALSSRFLCLRPPRSNNSSLKRRPNTAPVPGNADPRVPSSTQWPRPGPMWDARGYGGGGRLNRSTYPRGVPFSFPEPGERDDPTAGYGESGTGTTTRSSCRMSSGASSGCPAPPSTYSARSSVLPCQIPDPGSCLSEASPETCERQSRKLPARRQKGLD